MCMSFIDIIKCYGETFCQIFSFWGTALKKKTVKFVSSTEVIRSWTYLESQRSLETITVLNFEQMARIKSWWGFSTAVKPTFSKIYYWQGFNFTCK